MSGRLLRIAVIGHANTGKTSLLRTLLRDVGFGEVSDEPGTTREVAAGVLTVAGRPAVELFDTPGLEESSTLLEVLEQGRTSLRVDGPAMIEAFLSSPRASDGLAQEAKAIRQVLACDVALYVIDARDPVLGRHRDELRILTLCARPVVPVLNFIASPDARTATWRSELARVNMHAAAEFDTVVLEADGEVRLFEKIRSLADAHRATLDALIDERRQERRRLIHASARLIADTLVDVAAFAIETPLHDARATEQATDDMRNAIRRREQQCVDDLLRLHRFRPDDAIASPLPVDGGTWGQDLFSVEALEEYGVRGGKGAAAGAMVGLALDVMFGGMSLGAAAALGASIGAAVNAGRLPGRQLVRRLRGRAELRANEQTLMLMASRETHLARALLHRGHAAIAPARTIDGLSPSEDASPILRLFRRAARHHAWSRLNAGNAVVIALSDRGRIDTVDEAASLLIRWIDASVERS